MKFDHQNQNQMFILTSSKLDTISLDYAMLNWKLLTFECKTAKSYWSLWRYYDRDLLEYIHSFPSRLQINLATGDKGFQCTFTMDVPEQNKYIYSISQSPTATGEWINSTLADRMKNCNLRNNVQVGRKVTRPKVISPKLTVIVIWF